MASINLNTKHILRNDTTENWETVNPELSPGEIVYDKKKKALKINYNNQNTNFKDLDYLQKIDQTYDAHSKNAQSGKAVAQAIKPTTMYFDKIKFNVSTNILNESMVGSAAGWSNSGLDLTHSSGTTNPLQLNFGNLAVKNEEWLISFNATGVTSDYLYISFGNNPLTKVYNGGEEFNIVIPVSENNDSLIFTPTKEFNGTITNLQARKIVDEGGTEISLSSLTVSTGGTKKIKSGFWNVIIGTDNTLANSPNATRTIAMGYAALSKLISGNRNIAIGTHSMREMVGGESNISIGADNMMLVNQAEECVSIGLSALSKGTGIKQCIAIGSGALAGKEGKGATSCIAIGKNAGLVAEGTNCIYIGSGAGIKDLRSGNIVIGNGAFREAEYGNNNIVIGNGAYSGSSSYNGCIIIGDGAQPDKAKQTVIGNSGTVETKVYGDFVAQGTDGIKRKTIFSDGSVPMTGNLNMNSCNIEGVKTIQAADSSGIFIASKDNSGSTTGFELKIDNGGLSIPLSAPSGSYNIGLQGQHFNGIYANYLYGFEGATIGSDHSTNFVFEGDNTNEYYCMSFHSLASTQQNIGRLYIDMQNYDSYIIPKYEVGLTSVSTDHESSLVLSKGQPGSYGGFGRAKLSASYISTGTNSGGASIELVAQNESTATGGVTNSYAVFSCNGSPLKVTGIGTPTGENDAVNKGYIDNLMSDTNTKPCGITAYMNTSLGTVPPSAAGGEVQIPLDGIAGSYGNISLSSNAIQIAESGYYYIDGQVMFNNGVANKYMGIKIVKNGDTTLMDAYYSMGSVDYGCVNSAGSIRQLTAGDTVTLYARIPDEGIVINSSTCTKLTVVKLFS